MESEIKVNYNKNAKLTAKDILTERHKEIELDGDTSLEKVSNWSHRLICLSSPGRIN